MATWYQRFDSVGALFDHVGDAPLLGERSASHRSGNPDHYGSNDWAEGKAFATSGGWDGAGQQASDAVAAVLSTVRQTVAPQPERVYSVAGALPHVPMAIAGCPTHMVQHVPDPRGGKAKTVRIAVNIGALAMISGATMIRRGVAYVALCEVLASLGYSTDVWAVSTCTPTPHRKRGDRMSVAWQIKAAGGAVDRDRLIYNLANPGNLRRMAWAVRESFPADVRERFDIGGSYSASCDIAADVLADLAPDVVADAPLTSNSQAGDPVRFVIDTLRGLDLI